MRFARHPVLLPLLSLLAACSPTTPLLVAQAITGEIAEYKQMKSNRVTAVIEEKSDLLTCSAMAIRDNRNTETEKPYLTSYNNNRYSAEVYGVSSCQVGPICMSRYNDRRDDAKTTDYFQRVIRESPDTHAAEYAQARLLTIRQRAREPVQESAHELLAAWKPQQNLDLYKTSLDPGIALLSRHVVLKDRVDGAAELYLLAVNDPAILAGIKEKVLYQLDLVYLAPDNPHPSRDKTIGHLRRRLLDYPEDELSNKTSRHLDQALNVQPR